MRLVKKLSRIFIQPRIRKSIHRSSIYKWKDIELFIPPGIFHPAYFFSTQYLLKLVMKQDLEMKKILELGAGNGLISIAAAKRNAVVTSSDISERVITVLKENSKNNGVYLDIILSDVFEKIPLQAFDLIVINPPYYPKTPRNDFEQAWFCGVNFEYFEKLFCSISPYLLHTTKVMMVLSEECDLLKIQDIASKNNLSLKMIEKKRIYWEMNYIFDIRKKVG